jgi:small subunit ribosomal protein S6
MAKKAPIVKKVKESKTKSVLTAAEKQELDSAIKYELMFILSPMLTEEKRKKVVAELVSVIESKDGKIFHIDDWGKRYLAYKIRKFEEGYYMIYYFTLTNAQNINEIDEHLRLDQSVLRHLVMKREDDHEIRDFFAEAAEIERKKAEEAANNTKKETEVVRKSTVSKKVDSIASASDSEV